MDSTIDCPGWPPILTASSALRTEIKQARITQRSRARRILPARSIWIPRIITRGQDPSDARLLHAGARLRSDSLLQHQHVSQLAANRFAADAGHGQRRPHGAVSSALRSVRPLPTHGSEFCLLRRLGQLDSVPWSIPWSTRTWRIAAIAHLHAAILTNTPAIGADRGHWRASFRRRTRLSRASAAWRAAPRAPRRRPASAR